MIVLVRLIEDLARLERIQQTAREHRDAAQKVMDANINVLVIAQNRLDAHVRDMVAAVKEDQP